MATAALDPVATPPAGKGKKKLIVILAVVLLLIAIGGGAALMLMKQRAAAMAAQDDEDGNPVATRAEAHRPSADKPPTYVALDPFTVNLADRETERFAQVALTFEVDDPKFAEQMKDYMPAIRNAILLILAHKTSQELLERSGKDALAREIMRESVRPMGIEIGADDGHDAEAANGGKDKGKRRPAVHNPVRRVLFANFIIQ